MFTTYPSRMEPVRADIAKGDTDSAEDPIEDILDSSNVSDRVLYLQEHGRISQIGDNDIDESIESYSEAIAIVKERDQQAVVRSSDVGATIASIATSDNAIPYEPPPHERAFLRTFQAMNYLQQGDFESARVEVLNLQYEQEAIRKRQQQELDELEAKLAAKNPDGSPPTSEEIAEARQSQGFIRAISNNATLRGAQGGMASEVGDVRSARENAYSYYVSGL
ncbi:MAG: hypothetical protein GY910_14765, partial [bacterium]|nr:hypothetical protein [bacterium]